MRYKDMLICLSLMGVPSLALSDMFPICTADNSQRCPSVASDGANYLVVWQDHRGDNFDIYGQQVNTLGELAGSAVLLSEPSSSCPGHQNRPDLAFDGANYLVVWEDRRGSDWDIYGQLVSSAMQPVGNNLPICVISGGQHSPVVGFDGTNYLVVWEDWSNGLIESDIYGRVIEPDGVPATASFSICSASKGQRGASIGFNGSDYFVAWFDYRNGFPCKVYGRIVSPSGVPGSEVCVADRQYECLYPGVGSDGSNYLVTWSDYTPGALSDNPAIRNQRVNAMGMSVGAPVPVYATTYSERKRQQCAPSIAFDGANYLVVWQGHDANWDVFGQRVDPSSGDPVSGRFRIATNHGGDDDYKKQQWQPSVAFGGGKYLVVWEDLKIRNPRKWDIWATIVNP